MIRRIGYYLSSVPTILGQICNWHVCLGLLLSRKPVVIRLRNGCQFKVRSLMDVWVIKETCLDRDYEANATAIQDNWTIIDIGAGLGDFAISVAYEYPTCRVYAYEPFPESYKLLEENIALNGTGNVIASPIAVGAQSGQMTLFATGAAVQHTTTQVSSPAAGISVQGFCLDDLFAVNALTTCDFLKMDCEGGEYDILFNASPATLEKISNLSLEYHDGVTKFSHRDLVGYLQQNGFQLKTVSNPVHNHLGFLYAHR